MSAGTDLALIRERFEGQGLDVAEPMSAEAFAAYVRAESERYAKRHGKRKRSG